MPICYTAIPANGVSAPPLVKLPGRTAQPITTTRRRKADYVSTYDRWHGLHRLAPGGDFDRLGG